MARYRYMVLAELRAGFLCGSLARRNEQTLTLFLNSPRVRVLLADEGTTHLCAASTPREIDSSE